MTLETADHRQARLASSRRGIFLPALLFAALAAVYCAGFYLVLAAEFWTALLLSPLLGFVVINLFIVAHDACHQSFTSSPRLNRIIGTLAMLPSLHGFSLWDHEHNRRHHRFNNIGVLDHNWEPMTLDDYRRAGRWQRLKYRFYRSFIGAPFYYLVEIWAKRMIVARAEALGRVHWTHIADAVLIWLWIPVHIAAAVLIGQAHGKSAWESALFAVLIPFIVFSMALSIAILFHHTHIDVPWYRDINHWKRENGAVNGIVHTRMPAAMSWLFLNIMEHNAHHYAPGVPLYRLRGMQEVLIHPMMSVNRVTPWRILFLCRNCKFFDYENGQWQDFRGRATSLPLYKTDATVAPDASRQPAGFATLGA